MVRLTRIYTRTGDKGDTGLATGERIRKHHLRVEAYGGVEQALTGAGLARGAHAMRARRFGRRRKHGTTIHNL